MTIAIEKLFLGSLVFIFVAWFSESPALSQGGMIHDTREHILEDGTTPHLSETFKKKYPFVKEVVWSKPADFKKQLDDLIEGKAVVDAFRPAPNLWSQYFSHNLFRNYDFKKMAEGGHLNIPREMIDESGVVVWSGS